LRTFQRTSLLKKNKESKFKVTVSKVKFKPPGFGKISTLASS
jgi:hypothetical protein